MNFKILSLISFSIFLSQTGIASQANVAHSDKKQTVSEVCHLYFGIDPDLEKICLNEDPTAAGLKDCNRRFPTDDSLKEICLTKGPMQAACVNFKNHSPHDILNLNCLASVPPLGYNYLIGRAADNFLISSFILDFIGLCIFLHSRDYPCINCFGALSALSIVIDGFFVVFRATNRYILKNYGHEIKEESLEKDKKRIYNF
jgi:hypothetical protein